MKKKLLVLIFLCAASAFAQEGPPITVTQNPVPVYAPFTATSVTIVQIAGTSVAYKVYDQQGRPISNQAAGATYTFSPQPALTFPQGQAIGYISIVSGTSTFRPTAIPPSSGGSITGSVSPPNLVYASGTNQVSDVPGSATGGTGAIALTSTAVGVTPLSIGSVSSSQTASLLDVHNGSSDTPLTPFSVRGFGLGAFTPGSNKSLVNFEQQSQADSNFAWVITNRSASGSSGFLSSMQAGVNDSGLGSLCSGNAVGNGNGPFGCFNWDSTSGITVSAGQSLAPSTSVVPFTIHKNTTVGNFLNFTNSSSSLLAFFDVNAGLTVPAITDTGITGSTQCVQASSAGLFSGTGSACGGGGGLTLPFQQFTSSGSSWLGTGVSGTSGDDNSGFGLSNLAATDDIQIDEQSGFGDINMFNTTTLGEFDVDMNPSNPNGVVMSILQFGGPECQFFPGYMECVEQAAPPLGVSGTDVIYFDSTTHLLTCLTSSSANCNPGGGGSPGGSSGNLQGNNSGAFGGIPGTTADFTNGFITIQPPSGGLALTLVSADTDDTRGAESLVTESTETDSTNSADQFPSIVVSSTLGGTGVAGDQLVGIILNTADVSTGGAAAFAENLQLNRTCTALTVLCYGMEINTPSTAGGVTNVGLNIEDQTGGTNNYAIRTGAGTVLFGSLSGGGVQCVEVDNTGKLAGTSAGCGGGGGSGTVTSIATTAPLGGGPITTTGTLTCTTCTTNASALTASHLVVGAGSQAASIVASLGTTTTVLHGNASGAPSFGAVALATDVSGQLPIGAVGSSGLSGTSPISIASTGVISCSTCTVTIANGTAALGTSAIPLGACATVVTVTASGVATTDDIISDFNADPTSTTGYSPSVSGMLTIIKYPTSGNVNFKVCNNTSASITPGAVTLNWRVVR